MKGTALESLRKSVSLALDEEEKNIQVDCIDVSLNQRGSQLYQKTYYESQNLAASQTVGNASPVYEECYSELDVTPYDQSRPVNNNSVVIAGQISYPCANAGYQNVADPGEARAIRITEQNPTYTHL